MYRNGNKKCTKSKSIRLKFNLKPHHGKFQAIGRQEIKLIVVKHVTCNAIFAVHCQNKALESRPYVLDRMFGYISMKTSRCCPAPCKATSPVWGMPRPFTVKHFVFKVFFMITNTYIKMNAYVLFYIWRMKYHTLWL